MSRSSCRPGKRRAITESSIFLCNFPFFLFGVFLFHTAHQIFESGFRFFLDFLKFPDDFELHLFQVEIIDFRRQLVGCQIALFADILSCVVGQCKSETPFVFERYTAVGNLCFVVSILINMITFPRTCKSSYKSS